MTKGNLILLKGRRNEGKSTLAVQTVNQFVRENPSHRAIYVGQSSTAAKNLLSDLSEQNRKQVACLTIDSISHCDGEYLLAPLVAMHAAS